MSLRPAERILGLYAAVVVAVSLARLGTYPGVGWVALAHLLVLALLMAVRRSGDTTIRAITPIVTLLALYGALDVLNGFGAGPTHDRSVRHWEVATFGMEVGRVWWQRAPSAFWSTVLHAAYFSYYLIVPAPIALFLVRNDRAALDRATTAVMAAFTACYLCFIFFPVAGPYYEYPRPAAWFTANLPARTVYAVLAGGSSFGAAFPSSHVAATWAAAVTTMVAATGWGALLSVMSLLLTVGVVYCQMHYGVDALAGLGVAGLAIGLALRIHPTADRSAQGS